MPLAKPIVNVFRLEWAVLLALVISSTIAVLFSLSNFDIVPLDIFISCTLKFPSRSFKLDVSNFTLSCSSVSNSSEELICWSKSSKPQDVLLNK